MHQIILVLIENSSISHTHENMMIITLRVKKRVCIQFLSISPSDPEMGFARSVFSHYHGTGHTKRDRGDFRVYIERGSPSFSQDFNNTHGNLTMCYYPSSVGMEFHALLRSICRPKDSRKMKVKKEGGDI